MGNCSDVLQTVDTLVGIVSDALYAGNLDNLPPLSNGNWDCANVRSTIENLFDIFTDAISNGTIAGLPPINKVTLPLTTKHLSVSVTFPTSLTLLSMT